MLVRIRLHIKRSYEHINITPLAVTVGLPKANAAMVGTLTKVATKRVQDDLAKKQISLTTAKPKMEIVTEESGDSAGFGVMKMNVSFDAQLMDSQLICTALDKKNTMYHTTLDKALKMKDTDLETELQSLYKQGNKKLGPIDDITVFDRSITREWFKDAGQREMFLVRAGNDTAVYFFDSATSEAELVSDGQQARAEKQSSITGEKPVWTFGDAFFSPAGSFLATTHTQGVRLWAGEDFAPVARLPARDVANVRFSANEEYVATWNGLGGSKNSIFISNVRSGEVIQSIPVPHVGPHGLNQWPYVVFSRNSQYLAAAHPKGITIYSLPSMTEVSYNDPVKGTLNYLPFENAQFAWQPAENDATSATADAVLAVWVPAANAGSPCRMLLISLPSMTILMSKNLFSASSQGRIFWQGHGRYCGLLSRVSRRLQGKPKAMQSQLEIFKFGERSMPVDPIIEEEEVLNVFWSDSRDRLALLTANRQILFYAFLPNGPKKVATIDIPREINCVCWSPLGTHFVLGAIGSADSTGTLWFGTCIEKEGSNVYTVEFAQKTEMNRLSRLSWDPSGRFLTSIVHVPRGSETAYRYSGSAGFIIWSFQGRALLKRDCEELYHFQWRPHPPSTLREKEKAEIRSRMKDYAKRLDAADSAKRSQRKAEIAAEQARIKEAFETSYQAAGEWLKTQPQYASWMEDMRKYEETHPCEEVVIETEEEISNIVKPTVVVN